MFPKSHQVVLVLEESASSVLCIAAVFCSELMTFCDWLTVQVCGEQQTHGRSSHLRGLSRADPMNQQLSLMDFVS